MLHHLPEHFRFSAEGTTIIKLCVIALAQLTSFLYLCRKPTFIDIITDPNHSRKYTKTTTNAVQKVTNAV